MRFRAAALVGLAGGSSACTTHQCDASSYDFYPRSSDSPSYGGYMEDADTYVTSGLDEAWLSYPGNVSVRIWFPAEVAGRTWDALYGNVGTAVTPNEGGGGATITPAVGQLEYFTMLNTVRQTTDAGTFGGSVLVMNASCQKYFARFTVHFLPVSGLPPPGLDAGAAEEGDLEGGPGSDGAGD